MSTQINVTVGSGGLSDKARQLQTAARQAQLEKERQQRLEAQGTEQRTAKLEAEGKAPDGSPLYGAPFNQPQIERRPAANRQGVYFVFTPTSAPTVIENVKIWPQTSSGLQRPITFGEITPQTSGISAPSTSFFSENAFVVDASSLTLSTSPAGRAISRAIVTTGLQRLRSVRARKVIIQVKARACEAISYGITATASDQLSASARSIVQLSTPTSNGLQIEAISTAISGNDGQILPVPLPPTPGVSIQRIEVTSSSAPLIYFPINVDTFRSIKIEFSTKETFLLVVDGVQTVVNVPIGMQAAVESLLVSTAYNLTVSSIVELGSSNLPLPSPPSIDPALKDLRIEWQ